MANAGNYIVYHGILCPKETHSFESLKYAEQIKVEDEDIFTVTYPKSGKYILYYNVSMASCHLQFSSGGKSTKIVKLE